MGRWGDKLYESDAALDYFARITDHLFGEIAFRLAPEQVAHGAQWIANIMTSIEIMLVFDKNDVGSLSCFMDQEQAVKRWRETFFSVWDAEWDDLNDAYLPFHIYAYRLANRAVAIKWFDRLDELAAFWTSDDPNQRLSEYSPEMRLPYFSAPYSGFMLDSLIEWLMHSITFEFYDEKRELAIGFYETEKVWVAVDVMALLCETYACSPSVTDQTIEIWQKKMTDNWKARLSQDAAERLEDHEFYKNIAVRFNQLKALAEKYPPPHA